MTKKPFKIYNATYDYTIYCTIGGSLTNRFNTFAKLYKIEDEIEDTEPSGYAFSRDDLDIAFLYLADAPSGLKYLRALHHEVIHVSLSIFSRCGINAEQSEESFCYLSDWLFNEIAARFIK